MRSSSLFLALLCVLTWVNVGSGSAWASLDPEKVHTAGARKTGAYIEDGLFVGGDRAIDEVVIKDIRRAPNPGYERLVIDLEGSKNGEPAAIPRPPYFQIAAHRNQQRLIVTLWGRPKLAFDSRKVLQAFRKSTGVEKVELLPRLNDYSWTFSINFKTPKAIEVFELSSPVRLIVDVKESRKVN